MYSFIPRRITPHRTVFIRCHIRVILYAIIGTYIIGANVKETVIVIEIGIGTGNASDEIVCEITIMSIAIVKESFSNVRETENESWNAKGKIFLLQSYLKKCIH